MTSTTMRAITLNSAGLADLHMTTLAVPRPGPDEVLIRVKAASINYRDLVVMKGVYKPDIGFPFVPLSDASGEVAEVGSAVSRFRVGDRVIPTFIQGWYGGLPIPERRANWTLGWPRTGVLQEFIVVPADDAVLAPRNLNHFEASTLSIAGVTAWSALRAGNIKAGDWVLVQGTGGVSLFALQLARSMGARVVLLTSNEEKAARAVSLGADHVIDYRTTPEWAAAVMSATDGRGVDIVVETAGNTLSESLKAVAFGGFVGVVGFLGGFSATVGIVPMIERMIRVEGIAVGSRNQFEAMNRAIEAHDIVPVIDSVTPFERAAEAFQRMEAGKHFGKMVIEF
ncbi:zinc-dependent alcohol dehydrogenase family protein [Methyloversatilis discipulorum]|uniref:zinc-dependent alcohol dehydrogenase family protein n=1 Tax=Methyloversatilis discipulorum TaxID=1119528 RepID=UPI0004B3C86D|nr:NAD(P)-dependent alcohol dehydrogenase [Methyloversatilis discipulorum]